jgi:hypothetical protein
MSGSWSTFTPPSSMGSFSFETMLLLTDGSVLIHDLNNYANWLRLIPDGQGNYPTGAWIGPLPMSIGRYGFSSAVLRDGRVYVIGGEYSYAGNETPSGEIFVPWLDEWGQWGPLAKPGEFSFIQGDAPGAVLADGRVLLGNTQFQSSTSSQCNTALWDPATGEWTLAGTAFGTRPGDSKAEACGEETWTLLADGSVLTVDVGDAPQTERYIPSLDLWVPDAKTKSNLPMPIGTGLVNEIGPAILLPDGRLFAIGATGQTALYTPAPAGSATGTQGTWAEGPPFPADTSPGHLWATLTAIDAPAVLQTNGKVLLTAGTTYENAGPPPALMSKNMTLLEFDPATNALSAFLPALSFSPSSPPDTYKARFLLLPTGQILLTTQSSEIYIYTPDAATNNPAAAWRPASISVPSDMYIGYSYTVSGTQLNGLSQAVSFGDDAQMATNYPIVQLSNAVGQVAYARSYDFSTMGVATGTTVQSCTIDIPSGLEPGEWNLVVIANGIPSERVTVNLRTYPCQGLADNPPDRGDFNTDAEYHGAIRYWLSQLKECLKEYGSP